VSPGERGVALALAVSAAAGVALTVVYALGGQPQAEGALLAAALGGLGAALLVWERRLLPERERVEERVAPSPPAEVAAAGEALEAGGAEIARRPFLVRLLLAALGALGAALVFPVRSLGPRPGRALLTTAWTAGSLVVRDDGTPIRADDLPVGTVLTVFPLGAVGRADSQALLIRVPPGSLRLPPDRAAGAPDGIVCYSKVCTHAGCPVGLYRAETHRLLCPCHQSTFDVLRGARPVFGPATRPLPQLPLLVGDDGLLRAAGDFTEPVGPGFFDLPRRQR
jgi:ubiquinol-cytochrome c reductase iron-sulfur subunit